MKILIVGGTGLTGAHAALYLRAAGHEVTINSRSTPDNPALADFDHIAGSYLDATFPLDKLAGFDALVFAAGADIRLLPPDEDEDAFFTRVNTEGVPSFMAKAKAAGIPRAVYSGTYYPQVIPEAIETSSYVRSRHLADEGVRALSDASFDVCSLNAPFILGHVPGVALPHLEGLVHYCAGRIEGLPLFAPQGGVNHITSRSMSEAIAGALAGGKGGHAYLVGDENITWKDYLERYCRAVGNPMELEVSDQEHPMFPDAILYAGRGATIAYEPDVDELGYSRGQVDATIEDIVRAYL